MTSTKVVESLTGTTQ